MRQQVQGWIYHPRWDLTFLVASCVLAFSPYLAYLLFGGNLFDSADLVGTAAYNARVFVNTLVAVFIGGPHMYATFTRTMMDPVVFNRKKTLYIVTAIAVPLFVFGMAILSYETYVWLLTIFFGMASIHALHQIMWISGAYDLSKKTKAAIISKAIDYGVVFASLYPVPVWKMVNGNFNIGPISLKINELVYGWHWLGYLVFAFFFAMVLLFIGKSVYEWRNGTLHKGKTILIFVTINVMFWMMFLPNTDTAAQGINTWHSFQYLALTWYAHKLIEAREGKKLGFMHFWKNLYKRAKTNSGGRFNVPVSLVKEFSAAMSKIDKDSGWSSFYLLTMALLPISSVIVIAAGFLLPNLHNGAPGADEVYTYMGLLSILLIHYVHDGLLFTDPEDLILEKKQAKSQMTGELQPELATA